MVAVEEEIEKETLLERIDAQTSNHMLMDSINSQNSLRSRKSMKSQTSIMSDDQGYINRYDIIDRPSGSCNIGGINKCCWFWRTWKNLYQFTKPFPRIDTWPIRMLYSCSLIQNLFSKHIKVFLFTIDKIIPVCIALLMVKLRWLKMKRMMDSWTVPFNNLAIKLVS